MSTALRDRALAFITMGTLLEAGCASAAVLEAVAGRGRGALSEAFGRVAVACQGGVGLSEALAEFFPDRADVLGGEDGGLPERLRQLGEADLQVWQARRLVARASRYPVVLATGFLLVSMVNAVALYRRPDFNDAETSDPVIYIGFVFAVALAGLVTALHGLTVGRRPFWATALPGSSCWETAAVAEFSALYAVYRAPGSGCMSPTDAARKASSTALRQVHSLPAALYAAGLDVEAASAIIMAEAGGQGAAGARALAVEMYSETRRESRRFAKMASHALLLCAAVGVWLLMNGVFHSVRGIHQ